MFRCSSRVTIRYRGCGIEAIMRLEHGLDPGTLKKGTCYSFRTIIWVVVKIKAPFWGTLNNRCRIILGTQKDLTTTHMRFR